jgi:hypothetical protein
MIKNWSLKIKLISMFAVLFVLCCLLLTALSFANSRKMAEELTRHSLTMKMRGDINSAKLYIKDYLGSITMAEGRLVDARGEAIEGSFEVVDAVAQELGVVATIFAREGDDFRRISTNVKKADGSRAVDTFLGSASAAYQPVMNKELFIGQAVILGSSYLAAYDPMVDESGAIIGIFFIGIPQAEVSAISQRYIQALLSQSGLAFLIILTVALSLTVAFALSLSRNIIRCTRFLAEGAAYVNDAADQVAGASQSLAEGATEQAAGLQESSSSLEEMSSRTSVNEDYAKQASLQAVSAKNAAEAGSKSMQVMLRAINEIKNSSSETAKIIKVIDEIAFQTNLLALNAAVEAARAGEAGKGFAVVAEEVRNLAKRSAEAAKNTTQMIDTSVSSAVNGVKISEEVGLHFSEIEAAIAKTTALVGEIAEAMREQSQGIGQINTAVSQIDQVTQQNAAHAEESASAAEELSTQADAMQSSVRELVALIEGCRRANAS